MSASPDQLSSRSLPGALGIGLPVAAVLGVIAYVCAEHPLSVIALLICLITAIPPLLQRDRDLFSPWNYTFYFIVLNVLLRSLFIDFDITGGITDLDDVFYRGKPADFLLDSTWVLLLGFICLTFGYLWLPNRRTPLTYRIFSTNAHDRRRMKLAIAAMLVLACGAFALFVYLTFSGFADLAIEMLSRHRGLSTDLGEYRAYGYLRLLIGLANVAIYLAYARLKSSRQDRRFYQLALGCGIFTAVAMAFYSQGRAAMVFVFLNLIFLKYYLEGQRFPWKAFALAAPLVIVLFVVTSSLRGGSGVDLNSRVTPMTIVAPIVLNNGGIDASKTGHVIDYINQTQEFQFGQTLVQFMIATVPRQLWPSKPTNLDTFVGEKIYGAETYGAQAVPPGFFAEMYMNYWYAGIVVGAFALGALMKSIQNLLVSNKRNVNFVVFYVVVLQSFGLGVLGSGFSSAVMSSLMAGIPMLVVLNFVTPRRVIRHATLPASS